MTYVCDTEQLQYINITHWLGGGGVVSCNNECIYVAKTIWSGQEYFPVLRHSLGMRQRRQQLLILLHNAHHWVKGIRANQMI